MNKSFLTAVIRDNWYLFAALVVCVGAFAYKVTTSSDKPETLQAEASLASTAVPGPGSGDGLDKLASTRVSDREKTLEIIQSHQAQVDANPKAEEAPALLSAMGNLYTQKLGDYTQAAACYESAIRDYPDWGEVRTAYLQLAMCYERLNDQQNARRIYSLMMEKFPEDSQEYQYANTMMYKGAITPKSK